MKNYPNLWIRAWTKWEQNSRMLLSLKLLRMPMNSKHKKKIKAKNQSIETWKTKTQKNLVFQKIGRKYRLI